MVASTNSLRIGIYGPEEVAGNESRGCGLWETGYAAAVRMAGGDPILLGRPTAGRPWGTFLEDIRALIWTGRARAGLRQHGDCPVDAPGTVPVLQPLPEEVRLCDWCRKKCLPLLAVDDAMQVLNTVYDGTLYLDLPKERPEALQHRHPPEKGLRHAIWVSRGTRLARLYGEGELVVNSEHRSAISQVARGFRIGAQALDGVIEAIEADNADWFAIGVQWRPAAVTASGLDIQLFRGLIDAARGRLPAASKRPRVACTAAA
jgi:putative glutamine amidotransferase